MRHSDANGSSVPTPPNAFDATFLTQVQGEEEPVTATEADLSGPWKLEPLHPDAGWPGAVAVLRLWESLDKGDVPEAVFLHQETGALYAALLSLVAREPYFHLRDQPALSAPLPDGYPVVSVFGEQGPTVRGWLRCYRPDVMAGLHLLEGLARSPLHLATVGDSAGGNALTLFGRLLAELLTVKQSGRRLAEEGHRSGEGEPD
jgi:hypothetical protein